MNIREDELTPAGRKIVGALTELIEHARTGRPFEEKFTVRRIPLKIVPREYTPADVAGLRERLHMSQSLFAAFIGVSLRTVQGWEQGRRTPTAMARRFFDQLNRSLAKDPAYGATAIKEACEAM